MIRKDFSKRHRTIYQADLKNIHTFDQTTRLFETGWYIVFQVQKLKLISLGRVPFIKRAIITLHQEGAI